MDAIAAYLAQTCHLPPPDAETERRLFEQGKRDELVLRNTRLVVSVAKRYQGQGVPLRDLVQEGIVGLMEAIDRFEPERGFRLSSYAVWYIRRAVVNAVKDNGIIRVPRNATRDLWHIADAEDRLAQELGRDPTTAEVATAATLDVTYIERLRRVDTVHSLDWEMDTGETLGDLLGDDGIEDQALTVTVISRLDALDERERDILKRCYLGGETQSMVAEDYGVTRQRIQQIAADGLERLREVLWSCPWPREEDANGG